LKAIAVALALFDFAPIFFLALGLFFLAQLVDRLEPRCRRLALASLLFVTVGAIARASSNVMLALTGDEIPFLATLIYVFGAPGFALMAESLMRSWMKVIGRSPRLDPWLVPSVISWIFLIAAFALRGEEGSGPWKAVLTVLFLGGSFLTALSAAVLGWKRRLHMAAALFALQYAGTFIFVSIRTFAPEHPLILLFTELLMLASQCAFAFACWRVAAEYNAKIGPTATTT
jgi:hypothetical protein